jgi:hypothetical protein
LRRSTLSTFALVAAAALAGCSGTPEIVENIKEGNYFQNPIFNTPDWARARPSGSVTLGPSGPVAPEDLVDAGGHCAPEAPKAAPQAEVKPAEPAPPPTPANEATPAPPAGAAAYGSVAGDLASAPMPQGPAPKPASVKTASAAPDAGLGGLQPEAQAGMSGAPLLGGIALGMTECQAVRRGGQPSNVSVGAGPRGERKVVITYLSGQWPGIYTFDSGRLKQVDAAPVPEKPKGKPQRKPRRQAGAPAKTARGSDVSVQ